MKRPMSHEEAGLWTRSDATFSRLITSPSPIKITALLTLSCSSSSCLLAFNACFRGSFFVLARQLCKALSVSVLHVVMSPPTREKVRIASTLPAPHTQIHITTILSRLTLKSSHSLWICTTPHRSPVPCPILHSLSTHLGNPLSLQLSLRLLVVLGGIDTVLVVVDKVEPWQDVQPDSTVSRVSRRNSLHVWGKGGCAVEWLAGLDLGDHLLHVALDFAAVLTEPVEAHCCV